MHPIPSGVGCILFIQQASMTNIYSLIQLHKLYELAEREEQLGLDQLVENSGIAFARLFEQYYSKALVYIFAGPELNGAQALASALALTKMGYKPQVYLFYQQGSISPETEVQRQSAREQGVEIREIRDKFAPPSVEAGAVVIDGLFGSELVNKLEGGFDRLVAWINSLNAEVVSIDLPSGLSADGKMINPHDAIVQAQRTITFEVPRLGMFLKEQGRYIGQWHVVSSGIGATVHEQQLCTHFCLSEHTLAYHLKPRPAFSERQDYGTALLLGGSRGRYGLVSLAAQAMLSSGLSDLHIACPTEAETILSLSVPEAQLLMQEPSTSLYDDPRRLTHYKALCIGIASDSSQLTADDLYNLFISYRRPIVLDGEAVKLLAEHESLLSVIPEDSVIMLEAESRDRLLPGYYNDLQFIEAEQQFASKHKLSLVYRAYYSHIVRKTGQVYFSKAGNSGMLKAGMGEVLTGIITGLLARGYDSYSALLLGLHLWGMAGDLYVGRNTMESLRPQYLLEALPTALSHLEG